MQSSNNNPGVSTCMKWHRPGGYPFPPARKMKMHTPQALSLRGTSVATHCTIMPPSVIYQHSLISVPSPVQLCSHL